MVDVAAFKASAENSRVGKDYCDFAGDEFGSKPWQPADFAFCKTVVDGDVAALIKPRLAQALAE